MQKINKIEYNNYNGCHFLVSIIVTKVSSHLLHISLYSRVCATYFLNYVSYNLNNSIKVILCSSYGWRNEAQNFILQSEAEMPVLSWFSFPERLHSSVSSDAGCAMGLANSTSSRECTACQAQHRALDKRSINSTVPA